jgi:UDP-3-O-[3-hydroxymyristoyl] glucosamine N-acyltransferase
MKLSEIAQKLSAELSGDGDLEITGINGLGEAREGELTFITDEKRWKDIAQCRASAVIVPRNAPVVSLPALKVKNPRFAFALALRLFHERPYAAGGISGRAVIDGSAIIGSDPTIHPLAVVAAGARIGDRVTLHPGASIGAGSVIGSDSVIHANVTVRESVTIGERVIIHAGAVIGSDGFGFVTENGLHHKIPQVGGVIIGDDVEIGANTTVDRATIGNTVIGKGTRSKLRTTSTSATIASSRPRWGSPAVRNWGTTWSWEVRQGPVTIFPSGIRSWWAAGAGSRRTCLTGRSSRVTMRCRSGCG